MHLTPIKAFFPPLVKPTFVIENLDLIDGHFIILSSSRRGNYRSQRCSIFIPLLSWSQKVVILIFFFERESLQVCHCQFAFRAARINAIKPQSHSALNKILNLELAVKPNSCTCHLPKLCKHLLVTSSAVCTENLRSVSVVFCFRRFDLSS